MCHGVDGRGGVGPALLGVSGLADEDLLAIQIAQGAPNLGMPAFAGLLSKGDIAALADYISEHAAKAGGRQAPYINSTKTAFYDIDIERVFAHPDQIWALAAAPDGGMIATTKQGELLQLSPNGEIVSVNNPPETYTVGVGGLLDIALHPNYSANGWIYVIAVQRSGEARGEDQSSIAKMRVLRGKIRKGAWADEQVIFEASAEDARANIHFGARLAFKNGLLHISLGDRDGDVLTADPIAQRLDNPYGKIHRISETGEAPTDNPFMNVQGALPTIYTLGHRAPQGLTVRPGSEDIFSSEHGPRGGDELNRILPGLNYGWPLVSYGVQYSGEPVSLEAERSDIEAPKRVWTPAIAVSAIQFYNGALFPEWNDSLLVGSLIAEKLIRISLNENGDPILEELVFQGLGRIRDIVVGPEGAIYVAVNKNDEADSEILRLTPGQ